MDDLRLLCALRSSALSIPPHYAFLCVVRSSAFPCVVRTSALSIRTFSPPGLYLRSCHVYTEFTSLLALFVVAPPKSLGKPQPLVKSWTPVGRPCPRAAQPSIEGQPRAGGSTCCAKTVRLWAFAVQTVIRHQFVQRIQNQTRFSRCFPLAGPTFRRQSTVRVVWAHPRAVSSSQTAHCVANSVVRR